jgi:hypothetical protein
MSDPKQLFLGLLLAHLAADFLFQPDCWVGEKKEKAFRSKALVLHSGVAGVLASVMSLGTTVLWWALPVTAASHWLIDGFKVRWDNGKIRWFLLDQALHLAVIGGLVWWSDPGTPLPSRLHPLWLATLGSETVRLWGVGILLVGIPGSEIVKTLMTVWDVKEAAGVEGFPKAGKWIGVMEREFILVFILSGHWEGIGFLVVAKSILRFGEINNSADRKLAEYVLLGTLASYLWAVAVGIAAKAMTSPLY